MSPSEIHDEVLRAFYPFRLPVRIAEDIFCRGFRVTIFRNKDGERIIDRCGDLKSFAKKHKVKFCVLSKDGIIQMEKA